MFRSFLVALVMLAVSAVAQADQRIIVRSRGILRRPEVQINNFNSGVRANVFGTRTVIDGNGNVFEVDAFGNARFRGNSFRGFSSFNSFNSGFVPFGFGGCR